MAEFVFDRVALVTGSYGIITVLAPDTTVTIQELYDAIRDYEDEPGSMDLERIVDGSGKQVVNDVTGEQVGVTITLFDWKVKFEDRGGPTWVLCTITGGNITFFDTGLAAYASPIEPAAFVNTVIEKSSSPTLIPGSGFSSTDRDVIEKTLKWLINRQELDEALGVMTTYDDDDLSVLFTQTVSDKDGNALDIRPGAPARRGKAT